VLGADVVVLQRTRFVLCEDDYLASPFCEPLEQSSIPFRLSPTSAAPASKMRVMLPQGVAVAGRAAAR
jgi:hypothetical protein